MAARPAAARQAGRLLIVDGGLNAKVAVEAVIGERNAVRDS
jgi:hypothetical protein